MPEYANTKLRIFPSPPEGPAEEAECDYSELDVTTNFSFLRGASHPDELVFRATELGYRAIGITDVNSLAGVVRAYDACKQVKEQGGRPPKLLVGARLCFEDGPDVLVWAMNRTGYGRLCRLLTMGKRRTEKGECALKLEDLLESNGDLLGAVAWEEAQKHKGTEAQRDGKAQGWGSGEGGKWKEAARKLREAMGNRLSLAVSLLYGDDDQMRLEKAVLLGRSLGIPLLATNHVHYHIPERRALQDVLTCVRHGCTISEAGFRLFPNGERYLKLPGQMRRLFAAYPQALARGSEIAAQCTFDMGELRYEYPDELVPAGKSAIEYLAELAWAGAATRYPQGVPERVRELVERELVLIEKLKYEAYFLTVYDL